MVVACGSGTEQVTCSRTLPPMIDELQIRQFQASDVDAVTALWQESLPSTQPWNDPQRVICRKRNQKDQFFFVGLWLL